jgi:uncharacterized protein (TIGR01777 family)
MDARHATKLHEIDMKSRRPVVLRARVAAAASTMREVMALAPVREMASRAGGLQLEQLAAIVVEPSGELVTQVARRQRVEAYVRAMAMLRWHAVMREAIMKLGESPRVVVSGASGAIGSELCAWLRTSGARVDVLVRRGQNSRDVQGGRAWWWEPREGGQVEPGAIDGAAAVVHLAAVNVMGRWTSERKQAIHDSRVHGTGVIARAAAQCKTPPKVLISASGAHAYGDRGDDTMTEDADYGTGFLAELVRDWEGALAPAREAGVRTVAARIGVVLHARSGAVGEMSLPFSLGLGVIIGSGRQHWPWVSMVDAVGAIVHGMSHASMQGPVNVVGPEEVTAGSFARAFARAVDRPLFGRVPGALLRGVMGEQVDGLIMSTRVAPTALRRSGYVFALPGVEGALRWEVGRVRPSDVGIDVV